MKLTFHSVHPNSEFSLQLPLICIAIYLTAIFSIIIAFFGSSDLEKATHLVYEFLFSASKQFYCIPFFARISYFIRFIIATPFSWSLNGQNTFRLICYRSQQNWRNRFILLLLLPLLLSLFSLSAISLNGCGLLWSWI